MRKERDMLSTIVSNRWSCEWIGFTFLGRDANEILNYMDYGT